MFKRLILGGYAEILVIIAFATAATIFLSFLWHAMGMKREQADRFANLPFNSDSDDVRHDPSA